MASSGVFNYATYLGVLDGVAKFQLHDGNETMAEYKGKVDEKIKLGDKTVIQLLYTNSNSSDSEVGAVYEQSCIRTGVGRVDYVNTEFGYVSTDPPNHVRVFFFARNFKHPQSNQGIPLDSLVSVGDQARFEAVPQSSFRRATFRAVRVIPVTVSKMVREPSQIKHVKGQSGIIVKVTQYKSMYAWSRDLGKVFCPRSSIKDGKTTDLNIGNWVYLDVREQPEMDQCNWVAIQDSVTPSEKDYLAFRRLKNDKWTDLVLNDCPGLVTNVLEKKGQGVIWSWHLGKVLMTKYDTVGWNRWTPKTDVLFEAEQFTKHTTDDIGWRAIKVWAATSSSCTADSFIRCVADLSEFSENDRNSAILCNKDYGKIFMTYLDYYMEVPNLKEELKKHQQFDVWFVSDLKHHSTQWRAVHVRPVNKPIPIPVVSQNISPDPDSGAFLSPEDDFLDEIERELGLLQEPEIHDRAKSWSTIALAGSTSTYSQGPLDITQNSSKHSEIGADSSNVAQIRNIGFTDNESQTEDLLECRFFRLIRENKSLFNVMKAKCRHLILPMTQLMSSRFQPDLTQATTDTIILDGRLRTVSTQTASTPENKIAMELVADNEIFDLMVDIDSDLLFQLA